MGCHTSLPFAGDLPADGTRGRLRHLEHAPAARPGTYRGRLVSPEVPSCRECPRTDRRSMQRRTHRHWATWPLSLSIGGPSLFTRNGAARKSSRPDSKGRPADHGRTTQVHGSWKGVVSATKPRSLHPNWSRTSFAVPTKGRAKYASTAERSSGEVTATPEELYAPVHKVATHVQIVIMCLRRCVTVHLGKRAAASRAGSPASSAFPGAAEALDC
ncbi:hypothetical protein MTO96_025882 [Rhipicephalus appendiculatus]